VAIEYRDGDWVHRWLLSLGTGTLLGTEYTQVAIEFRDGDWIHRWPLSTGMGTGYTGGY